MDEDWAVFRGGPRFHAHRQWEISDSPVLVWTYDAGVDIESTAAIADGKAYVANADGDLLALDLFTTEKTGKLLWKFKAQGGIRSSPGYHKGRLYFGDDFGFFYAVDAVSGKEAWNLDTEGAEIIASANFAGDRVLFGSYDHQLYCLDAGSGRTIWKLETTAPIHSSPVLIGNRTFVTGCDEILRAVDIDTGKETMQMEMSSYTMASPVVAGSHLYVGTFASEFVAVDWEKRQVIWTYKHPRKSFPFAASAALAGDRLVVGGRDKLIHCLDRISGKPIWTFPTGARVECSPVIAGNRVIAGSSDKNLYLLDLDSGNEVWRYAADGAFLASPALAHGRLVIGTDNGLVYCFDVTTAAKRGRTESVSGK